MTSTLKQLGKYLKEFRAINATYNGNDTDWKSARGQLYRLKEAIRWMKVRRCADDSILELTRIALKKEVTDEYFRVDGIILRERHNL